MKRFRIEAMISLEVEAADETEAWDEVALSLEHPSIRDWANQASETTEIKYEGLPASGADRWAAAAAAAWLDHDDRDWRGQRFGMYDGSWWWTNGHLMLRCDGAPPTEGSRWSRVPDETIATAIKLDTPRLETSWTDALKSTVGNTREFGRRALAAPAAVVQERYFAIVADSLPGGTWSCGLTQETPFLAHDVEGRLMAVVMPMKSDSVEEVAHAAE